jgi:GntR family transcriptional repressor for pyruvate dehydrogenase complex
MANEDVFNLADVNLDAFPASNLSGRVKAVLLQKIREGGLLPGARLPTELVMAQRFGVSRTVIREAMATLKSEGIVEARQGAGAFVRKPGVKSVFTVDAFSSESVHHLLRMIEVRRAIDSETAALAAVRRDAQQIDDIRQAMAAIDKAVMNGGDGVREDVEFHLSIARATGNPYWAKLMEMFAPQIRGAISMTRANEARRNDFAQAVKAEHQRIVDAIIAGNGITARAAAAEHMERASERVAMADQEFWASHGKEHTRFLG